MKIVNIKKITAQDRKNYTIKVDKEKETFKVVGKLNGEKATTKTYPISHRKGSAFEYLDQKGLLKGIGLARMKARGSRIEVLEGRAKQTTGGLKKKDLVREGSSVLTVKQQRRKDAMVTAAKSRVKKGPTRLGDEKFAPTPVVNAKGETIIRMVPVEEYKTPAQRSIEKKMQDKKVVPGVVKTVKTGPPDKSERKKKRRGGPKTEPRGPRPKPKTEPRGPRPKHETGPRGGPKPETGPPSYTDSPFPPPLEEEKDLNLGEKYVPPSEIAAAEEDAEAEAADIESEGQSELESGSAPEEITEDMFPLLINDELLDSKNAGVYKDNDGTYRIPAEDDDGNTSDMVLTPHVVRVNGETAPTTALVPPERSGHKIEVTPVPSEEKKGGDVDMEYMEEIYNILEPMDREQKTDYIRPTMTKLVEQTSEEYFTELYHKAYREYEEKGYARPKDWAYAFLMDVARRLGISASSKSKEPTPESPAIPADAARVQEFSTWPARRLASYRRQLFLRMLGVKQNILKQNMTDQEKERLANNYKTFEDFVKGKLDTGMDETNAKLSTLAELEYIVNNKLYLVSPKPTPGPNQTIFSRNR